MKALQEMLPPGRRFYPCYAGDRQCGCLRAATKAPKGQCKIHGNTADDGARDALLQIRKAGYVGPVFTQVPLYAEPGKCQSRYLQGRRGGQFAAKATFNLDIVLASSTCPHRFVAVEVQGASHCDIRAKGPDVKKACAAHAHGFELFEMHVEQAVPSTKHGCDMMLGEQESVALEIVSRLH